MVHPAPAVPRRSRRRATSGTAETVGASRRTAVFAPVIRCVASQERRRVKIAPRQFGVFSARFSCAENGAGEKGIGAFLRRCWSRQPAVQAATRDCGVVKMALFSETPEPFDAKFEKNPRKVLCHRALRRHCDKHGNDFDSKILRTNID